MPSKSKSQQRFFGMVDAFKKGELKNASKSIKKAAEGMSMDDVRDFAKTKHKGLPEKVEENFIRLTEGELRDLLRYSVMRVLSEAKDEINKGKPQTITSKKVTSQDNRTKFNKDEVLKKALSYPTLSDLYRDSVLTQKLRYHGLLDYVREEFKKAGKYKGRGKRGKTSQYPKWTVESALEYASNFINGYELREHAPDLVVGRSCFHFLNNRDLNGNVIKKGDKTTPRLITMAFKDARKKDAEKASALLVNREERKQQEQEQEKIDASNRAAERRAKQQRETELRKQRRQSQKEIDKGQREFDRMRQKAKSDRDKKHEIAVFVAQNGIKTRMELYNESQKYYWMAIRLGMMDYLFGKKNQGRAGRLAKTAKLNKAKTPGHLERRFPEFSKELRAPHSNLLKRRFPGWKLVDGQWVKKT
jgi:hypothetical protein